MRQEGKGAKKDKKYQKEEGIRIRKQCKEKRTERRGKWKKKNEVIEKKGKEKEREGSDQKDRKSKKAGSRYACVS